MKQLFFSVWFLAFFGCAIAQENGKEFSLNGTITGLKEGEMLLSYSVNGKRIRDSTQIKNGRFSFKGVTEEPTMAYLGLKENDRNEDHSTTFFIEPGKMTIEVDFENFRTAKITGSKTQELYSELNKKKEKIRQRWQVVFDTLTAANQRSNFEYQELKNWVLQPYNEENTELDLAFINSHPRSYATAFLMRFYVSSLPLDTLQNIYGRMGEKLQNSEDGKELAAQIEKLRAGSPGSVAPGFSSVDINGKKVDLTEFKGKYVLLDFWASWCLPCRKGNPHLKEIYTKYKDKGFEIIGVASDDNNHEAWKKAVKQDGLPWIQVLRGFDMEKMMKGEPNPNDISNRYGIHTLPTKILIDPYGVIIGRYGEEEAALDMKLKEIFEN